MKGFKPLTLIGIKKQHSKNPRDKELQQEIENKQIDRQTINKLIKQSTKQRPFDRSK